MFSCVFALISALFCVSVTTAQSCGPSQLRADISLPSSLTSPNYPSNYPSSTTCEWTITADSGYVVKLTFVTFNTTGYHFTVSCTFIADVLEIYDGRSRSGNKLLGKYCSYYLPANVYSSGTSLYLRFISDSLIERKGFGIIYSAVIPRPNSTICSPFNTDYQNNNIQVSGSSGYIQSPLYGSKYPSSMQCTWVITVPEGNKIKLTFSDFAVGYWLFCNSSNPNHDHLQIKDGRYSNSTTLKTLCEPLFFPPPIYSTGRYMWIRFKSNIYNDNPGKTTGFKARFIYETLTTTRRPTTVPGIRTYMTGSRSGSSSDNVGLVVSIVIGVCTLIFLVCIGVYIAYRKRTSGPLTVQAPTVTQTTAVQDTQNQPGTTLLNPQQMQGGFVLHPPAGYSPAPQTSYPPQASGYHPSYQHQFMPADSYLAPTTGQHPQQPTPDDPPPAYPGPSAYSLQATTERRFPINLNPPYPPPQVEVPQYPPTENIKQATAPPPF